MERMYFFLGIYWDRGLWEVRYGDFRADVAKSFRDYNSAKAWIIENTVGWTIQELEAITQP